ncbi:MAG: HD domain-containing protein, partial [Planctomycetota bacterium]|nr:HD domain-containing protein [Planctomycetota bacterium]
LADAARRRDLTVNAIAYDPLKHELLDPHGGEDDLAAGRLRAVDPETFTEDPLRALRVAQFCARLEMTSEPALIDLCSRLDLSELAAERIQDEWNKLLLRAKRPSLGLAFLRDASLLRFFPEVAAILDVPQDPEWHPEGDVWTHTLLVLDEAARLRTGDGPRDAILMYGALCHDFGKATTTFEDPEGRVRSPGHEEAGVEPTVAWLTRLRLSSEVVDGVIAIVRHHLAPAALYYGRATDRGYRRLARKLGALGIDAELLHRSATADHFGRTTPDARARSFPEGDYFLERMEALSIAASAPVDVVQGRDLIARGYEPGPSFGPLLQRCREVQDETGWTDSERVLDRALADREDSR